MWILKNTISTKLTFLYLILLVLTGCTNAPEYSQGTCPFPPAESNFPVIAGVYSCEECYFKIQFNVGEYSFVANQFERTPSSPVGHSSDTTILAGRAWNSFLSFFIVAPSSVKELYNRIGVKTPLLKVETVSRRKLESFPPPVSAAFGIYNYCKDFFEPITGAVSQSWHQLTEVELRESYPVERDSEPYQRNHFYFYGELEMIFLINGELQKASANYKTDVVLYEKL